ncbi:MAG: response regulator [Okeania sp.]|nr:response regulator [Okeania sp.]
MKNTKPEDSFHNNTMTDTKPEDSSHDSVKNLKFMSGNKQLIQLAQKLNILAQDKAIGTLVLKSPTRKERLILFYGRLLYATSDIHRVRRWERCVKCYCPHWNRATSTIPSDSDKPWEYLLLYDGIRKDQITVSQAKAVISTVTLEIFFSMSHCLDLTYQWKKNDDSRSELSLGLSLSYWEIEKILTKVAQMQYFSKRAGLENFNPNLVPILKKSVDSKVLSNQIQYLKGDLTLWDISCKLKKTVLTVSKALLPLIKKNFVELQEIPDLPKPNFQLHLTDAQENEENKDQITTKKKPLIACIDDSIVVAERLRKIIEPTGYELMDVQDPVKGLVKIAEEKPDLIFLDLEMPDANGYTVYQFLRNAPVFAKIPIIIFTSRNNLIDRSRAKLMGAVGFLHKPGEPEEILKMIEKYLSVAPKFS